VLSVVPPALIVRCIVAHRTRSPFLTGICQVWLEPTAAGLQVIDLRMVYALAKERPP